LALIRHPHQAHRWPVRRGIGAVPERPLRPKTCTGARPQSLGSPRSSETSRPNACASARETAESDHARRLVPSGFGRLDGSLLVATTATGIEALSADYVAQLAERTPGSHALRQQAELVLSGGV